MIMLGKTYLTRLWCIVEIFVFVHMGGKPSNIVILPVAEDGEQDRDELAALSDTTLLQGFDARTCDCFVQEEREKILTIIATAFGGFDAFNAEVRSLLQRARAAPPCIRARRARQTARDPPARAHHVSLCPPSVVHAARGAPSAPRRRPEAADRRAAGGAGTLPPLAAAARQRAERRLDRRDARLERAEPRDALLHPRERRAHDGEHAFSAARDLDRDRHRRPPGAAAGGGFASSAGARGGAPGERGGESRTRPGPRARVREWRAERARDGWTRGAVAAARARAPRRARGRRRAGRRPCARAGAGAARARARRRDRISAGRTCRPP